MSEIPQNGFTQEQLVIYKLGQIESQLAALLVKLTDNNIQVNKDLLALDERVVNTNRDVDLLREDHNKLKDRFNTARARLWGAAIVISTIIAFSKDFIISWLKSFLPS